MLDLPRRIRGALGNLGTLLLRAGKDLVQGLIDGIRSMAGRVASALVGIVPGPLRALGRRLGLGSPSKITFGMGEDVGEGLVLGIRKMVDRVTAAAHELAAAGIPAMPSLDRRPMPMRTSTTPDRMDDRIHERTSAGGLNVTVNAHGMTPEELIDSIVRRVSMTIGMRAVA